MTHRTTRAGVCAARSSPRDCRGGAPIAPAALLLLFLPALAAGCKPSGGSAAPASPAAPPATPARFAERDAVIEAIDSGRFADAEATLRSAKPGPDVHFLRAKLAVARQDGETAFSEIRKAVEDAPAWAEYQYELGVIAPLPVPGLNDAQLESRLRTAGVALAKAVQLAPHEPRYRYAWGFFLSSAPPRDGGNPSEGKKQFDELVRRYPDSAWAHRVLFDRAAEAGNLDMAEAEAATVGSLDATEGARLYLLAAGSRLLAGEIDAARADLEAAARLKRTSAGGFCDAGYALDGGGRRQLAEPFWTRCLELDPEGPKSAQARARLGRL